MLATLFFKAGAVQGAVFSQDARSVIPADMGTWGLAVLDLDRDGHLDIAATNAVTGSLTVAFGDGKGAFPRTLALKTGKTPLSVAAGDFDGDGIPDLIVANIGSSDATFFRGQGGGAFSSGDTIPLKLSPRYVIQGEFNGDGVADIAFVGSGDGGHGSVSIFFGARGRLPQPQGDLKVGDGAGFIATTRFGSGKALVDDLVTVDRAADSISLLRNGGNGQFTRTGSFPAGVLPRTLAQGDFTGDGRIDFVSAIYDTHSVRILANDGQGGYALGPEFSGFGAQPKVGPHPEVDQRKPYSVISADFDRDGKLDVAVALIHAAYVSILGGDGASGFREIARLDLGTDLIDLEASPMEIAAGDFNEDGRPDLAVTTLLLDLTRPPETPGHETWDSTHRGKITVFLNQSK